LFRRSALEEIGGFDEVYDYFLDETDVCCRLVDAGYLLRQLHHAPVHHKFLPSSIRTPQRVVTNWFPIIKNQTYFAFRHALGAQPEIDVIDRCRASIDRWCADARFHQDAGRLPPGTVERVREIGGGAMRRGMELGLERHEMRLAPLDPPTPEAVASFRRYPVIDSAGRRCIAIVTGDYPPRSTGGIARFLGEVAPASAERGHEVRVITRVHGDAPAAVDLEDGVWVHRLDPAPMMPAPMLAAMLAPIGASRRRRSRTSTRSSPPRPSRSTGSGRGGRSTSRTDRHGRRRDRRAADDTAPCRDDARHAGRCGCATCRLARRRTIRREPGRADAHRAGAVLERPPRALDQRRSARDRRARVRVGRRSRPLAVACDRSPRPPPGCARGDAPVGPTRVLFVGRLEARKGIDDLLCCDRDPRARPRGRRVGHRRERDAPVRRAEPRGDVPRLQPCRVVA
jgi:hypothetical protein